MNAYEKMFHLLNEEPRARERKNKQRAIRKILVDKYPQLREISSETFTAIISETQTLDRAWRKVTEEHVYLRGSDYGDKADLVQKKQRELGYIV